MFVLKAAVHEELKHFPNYTTCTSNSDTLYPHALVSVEEQNKTRLNTNNKFK